MSKLITIGILFLAMISIATADTIYYSQSTDMAIRLYDIGGCMTYRLYPKGSDCFSYYQQGKILIDTSCEYALTDFNEPIINTTNSELNVIFLSKSSRCYDRAMPLFVNDEILFNFGNVSYHEKALRFTHYY